MTVGMWWPVILIVLAGLFAWMGAFILTRDSQNLRSRLAAAAFVALGLWYFCTAMMYDNQAGDFGRNFVYRLAVFLVPASVLLWFQAALLLTLDVLQPARLRLWTRLGWLIVGVGLALTGINALTRLGPGATSLPPLDALGECRLYCVGMDNPWFRDLEYFLHVAFLGTAVLFSLAYRSARQRQLPSQVGLLWLMIASYLFLTASLSVYAVQGGLLPSPVPGLLTAVSGLMIGWGVGKYNALVKHRVLERDFLLAFLEFDLIITIYIGLPLLAIALIRPGGIEQGGLNIPQFGLVTLLAVLSHTTITQVRRRIDLTLSADPAARMRSNVATLMQDSGQGAPLTTTVQALELVAPRVLINQYVDKQLLRKLDAPDSQEYLANCPLQNLAYVSHILTDVYHTPWKMASASERAGAILHLLHDAAERIRAGADHGAGRRQIVAAVLSLRLEEGLDRAAITRRLNLHVRTYDRLLDLGVQQLADAVFELEKQQRLAHDQELLSLITPA